MVRAKTEYRRQAIIDVALDVFREVGFERASMALISRRLGGSKGTLYGYFKSKEELFETVMKAASEGPGDQIMSLLEPKLNDLHDVLSRFARAYVGFILDKEVIAITRTAIHEGAGSSLGCHLFEQGPGRALSKMECFFEEQISRGRLRKASARSASLHFKGLIESGFLEEALYGAPIEREEALTDAVDVFLRAYAV